VEVVNFPFIANQPDCHIWICPPGMKYRLHYLGEIHVTAESTATTFIVAPTRTQGTEAPASGDALAATVNLKGTAETLQAAVLVASTVDGTFDLVAGNRLSLNFTQSGSTSNNLAGAVITAILMPINDVRYQIL
jgi:hypothetical protein